MTTEALNPNPDAEEIAAPAGDVDQSNVNDNDGQGGEQGEDQSTALGGKPDAAAEEGEQGKVAEEEEKPAGAPEKYEIAAPEGMEFDKETFAAVEPVLRELNITNEGAQKLAEAYGKQVLPIFQQRADDAIATRAADQRKEWDDAFTADPDIGGAKKDDTLAHAAKAFDYYGLKKGEGLRQLLDESGLGNHPDMIRFVARVGRDIGEETFQRGGSDTVPLTVTEKFYGKGYGKPQAEQRS